MRHYLQTEDGKFKITVEMGCNHPGMKNNSTDSIGCNGKCEECKYSIASCTIPEMDQLLELAKCLRLQ